MSTAMQRIRGGQRFVATNSDSTYPMEGGRLIPGAGSIVAAIRTCSEQEPFVVGKPNPYMVTMALEGAGVRPSEALVVGDRLDTDIASGIAAGCPTHLVLTGVAHSAPEGQSFSPDLKGLL
jgi:HAD superfamily hydrolase (TIGR01450 family)